MLLVSSFAVPVVPVDSRKKINSSQSSDQNETPETTSTKAQTVSVQAQESKTTQKVEGERLDDSIRSKRIVRNPKDMKASGRSDETLRPTKRIVEKASRGQRTESKTPAEPTENQDIVRSKPRPHALARSVEKKAKTDQARRAEQQEESRPPLKEPRPANSNTGNPTYSVSSSLAAAVSHVRRGGLDAFIRRIVSRVTSQELEETNLLERPAIQPLEPRDQSSNSAEGPVVRVGSEGITSKPGRSTRIVTIPMSAVPPRLQLPGSIRGMPPKIRIVEIDRSHQDFIQRVFRRNILDRPSTTSILGSTSDSTGNGKPSAGLRKRTYSVDLHGGIVGVGEYYSVIELGGKKIRVQIDTGSSTLAVPMTGCKSCIAKASRYEVDETKGARAISCTDPECASDRCTVNCPVCSPHGACCSAERPKQCGFSLRYADGSAASGSLVTDEVQWGGLRSNITFGGILSNSPNFERPEVDGILGMAFKSLACNPSCFDPPFDVFVKEGHVENIFSICMTSKGGKLMLGGFTPSVARTPVQYVPLYLSEPARYYRVHLTGALQIGSEQVTMPNFRSAIVDTGTTLIVTSTRTFASIREHFQRKYCEVPELCGEDSWFQSGMCVSLSKEDLARLPTLTIQLGKGGGADGEASGGTTGGKAGADSGGSGSVNLELRPEDYMLEYRRGPKTYRCVGIMGMDGLGGMVVLGNTLMQKYITVYDRENGRLGFAEAAPNCGDKR